jgi:aquaporin NIP
MQTSESNRISIIISPRAASSNIMPFEMANADAGPAAESSDAWHRWNQGCTKIKPAPLIKKVKFSSQLCYALTFTF